MPKIKVKGSGKKPPDPTTLPSSRPFVTIPGPSTALPGTGGGGHDFGSIPVYPRPTTKTTEERVTSAKERTDTRMSDSTRKPHNPFEQQVMPTMLQFGADPTKTPFTTPFGSINLSKFPTRDPGPKITTVATEYGNETVGHKYSELAGALTADGAGGPSESDLAKGLLEGSGSGLLPQSKKIFKPGKRANAAAKMLGISHISEQKRFGGSAKMFRGVLRMIEAGEASFEDAFTGDTPLFPMAKTPTYMRRLINVEKKKLRKPPPRPAKFDRIAAYMSDSSDDEDG